MSSMRTKTHVADIVGDNVFCEKIADKKVNLSCRLLCSLHCCLQGKPLSFMWIFSIFHIIIRAEMVPTKIAKISFIIMVRNTILKNTRNAGNDELWMWTNISTQLHYISVSSGSWKYR